MKLKDEKEKKNREEEGRGREKDIESIENNIDYLSLSTFMSLYFDVHVCWKGWTNERERMK